MYMLFSSYTGGWALVAEQLPYATGAAKSILLDRYLKPDEYVGDDRMTVVFVGEGGALNGESQVMFFPMSQVR